MKIVFDHLVDGIVGEFVVFRAVSVQSNNTAKSKLVGKGQRIRNLPASVRELVAEPNSHFMMEFANKSFFKSVFVTVQEGLA